MIGVANEFAHAAARSVAQAPGQFHNPLYLHGGVGLGKTHLLNAIGQFEGAENRRICFLSSEQFTNEYITAIQLNQLKAFRARLRQVDMLLIDDIHFLAGKERIQEEFFHTFNALHERRRQIVLTSDRTANEIGNVQERLVSRFEWGLVAGLKPPELETRRLILHNKAMELNARVPEDVIDFVATYVRTNVRRLEGALVRLAAFASLTGGTIGLETAERLLAQVFFEEQTAVSVRIEEILKLVASHFDLRVSDLIGKRRTSNVAFPRQMAMFLAREFTGHSSAQIGEAFGGRDHGTVLHGARNVVRRMQADDKIRRTVKHFEHLLSLDRR